MPITINTNVAALSAQRNLESASMRSQSSLSKLSSGSRVPTAKEDAASLSIGTGLKLDVTALRAAQTNAAQGTSLLQIADGAFGQVSNILDRMKSLATTAQSGQLSNTERAFLNDEYQSLSTEIDRIAGSTEFNGQALLGGSTTTVINAGSVGTDLESADGVVGFEFDSSVVTGVNAFELFYDDSEGNISVINITTGTTQTVNVGAAGATIVAGGATREVDFDNLGVKITLNDDFNGGNAVNGGADVNTAAAFGAGTSNAVFSSQAGTAAAALTVDFQVGIGSGGVAGGDAIQVSIDLGTTNALSGGAGVGDVLNAANAGTASTTVDTMIGAVNTARADIGSSLNRLEFAQSNLAVTIENTEAARSTLMDVDVSAEITKFTSEQVLIQAGVSMLAQANQQPSLLLRLLQ